LSQQSFRVDVDALRETATGVSGVLADVSEEKVTAIPCDNGAIGDDELAGALHSFLGRWQRGVDNLAGDAQEFAARLVQSATAYTEVDEQVRGQIGGILSGTGPDPGMRG
jgi:hypothetical protein